MNIGVLKKQDQVKKISFDRYTNDEIEVFIDKYTNTVFQLAHANTKNKQLAEDIFQEVFLKLIKKKRNFKNYEHEKAWIIRVTLNCCKDFWKSAWTRHTVPLEEVKEIELDTDKYEDIYQIVMALPENYRIHLFYYEELSIVEIGRILKLNKNTVATRLKRAREILKVDLKKGGYNYGI